MTTGKRFLLHGPLSSRTEPLDRANAASRISAYVYGNILVLAALVPVHVDDNELGIAIVLGTALSTFVAHAFAEAIGETVREGTRLAREVRLSEVRDSVPVLTSAVLPCLILGCGALGWLEPVTAQRGAEIAVLLRLGGIVFVIGHLHGERPTRTTVVGALFVTAVATAVVIVKIILTH
jgi:hypothetical protein